MHQSLDVFFCSNLGMAKNKVKVDGRAYMTWFGHIDKKTERESYVFFCRGPFLEAIVVGKKWPISITTTHHGDFFCLETFTHFPTLDEEVVTVGKWPFQRADSLGFFLKGPLGMFSKKCPTYDRSSKLLTYFSSYLDEIASTCLLSFL